MRSGASGAACFDASFAVSAMRARVCRLYWALSIIAPPVNVLRRTRRKPSTIRGAAPDIVIGQSTAVRAGAHPRSGSVTLTRAYSEQPVKARESFHAPKAPGLAVFGELGLRHPCGYAQGARSQRSRLVGEWIGRQ